MNPKCESSSVFPYGPHPNNRIALPPPKPSPVPSVPGYIYMAFRKRLSRWESDFPVRLLQDPDPFCLSVCPFLFSPHPIGNTISHCPCLLSYCWVTGALYSSLGQWHGNVNSWGCGMQDRLAQTTGKVLGWVIGSEQKLTSRKRIGEG